MKRPGDAFAGLAAVIAGSVVYAALLSGRFSQLWYLPLARAWSFGPKPAAVAMSWYGRTLVMLAVALLAAFVARRAPGVGERATRVGAAVAALALAVAIGLCVSANVHRATKPLAPPGRGPVICGPAL